MGWGGRKEGRKEGETGGLSGQKQRGGRKYAAEAAYRHKDRRS